MAEPTKLTEIPPRLQLPPDQQPAALPVTTRPQELPFEKLTWENFERLCLRVARQEVDIRQCFLYGTPGQRQRGIDFIGYAGDVRSREVRVYQCKRERRFTPAKIVKAVDTFLGGRWEPQPCRFVLCSMVPLRSTQFQEEIRRQEARLTTLGIDFEPWDSEALSERLKNLPDLVDDFFGRAWVEGFNGPAGIASLGVRLSGTDVQLLRSRMSELYSTLFDRHDPGLLGRDARRLSYHERYVAPDVSEHRFILSEVPSESPSPQSTSRMLNNS